MLMTGDRAELRKFYFQVWEKHKQGQPLEPLERQIVQVMLEHPEYHALLNQPDIYLEKEFSAELGESNPFLHMSLHLAIREQVAIDAPAGINEIFKLNCLRFGGDHLQAEHAMLEILVEMLWKMQKEQIEFDDIEYVTLLRSQLDEDGSGAANEEWTT